MENSLQNSEITEIQENTFWSWATFFSWRGRISRKEYWTILFVSQGLFYVLFFVVVIFSVIFLIDFNAMKSCSPSNTNCTMEAMGGYMALLVAYYWIAFFVFIWMFFVVAIKRFHDINMRGWWVLLPIANFIIPAFIK